MSDRKKKGRGKWYPQDECASEKARSSQLHIIQRRLVGHWGQGFQVRVQTRLVAVMRSHQAVRVKSTALHVRGREGGGEVGSWVGQGDRVPGLLLGGKGGHLLGEVQTPLYNIKMYAEKKKSKPNSETFNWKQSARIARAHNINFATIIVIINHHSGESDGENRCACGIQLRRARGNFWDKHSCLVYLPPPY